MSGSEFIAMTKTEMVTRHLINQIKKKKLPPGSMLLPESKLAKKLGVSMMCTRRAFADLCEQGLIHRVRGRGTFVTDRTKKTTLVTNFLHEREIFSSTVDKFKERHPLCALSHPTDPSHKFNAGYDICRAVPLRLESQSDYMMDLQPFIDNDSEFSLDLLRPEIRDYGVFNGVRVGLPICFCPPCIIFNEDIFARLGISVPDANWNWNDFTQLTSELNAALKDSSIYSFGTHAGLNKWASILWQNKGELFCDGEFVLGSKNAQEALEWFRELNTSSSSPPGFPCLSDYDIINLFADGKLAMTISNRIHLGYAKHNGIKASLLPLPRGKQTANLMAGVFLGIPKNSSNPKLAWDFIKSAFSKEAQSSFNKEYHHFPSLVGIGDDSFRDDERRILAETTFSRHGVDCYSRVVLNIIANGMCDFFEFHKDFDSTVRIIKIIMDGYIESKLDSLDLV